LIDKEQSNVIMLDFATKNVSKYSADIIAEFI